MRDIGDDSTIRRFDNQTIGLPWFSWYARSANPALIYTLYTFYTAKKSPRLRASA